MFNKVLILSASAGAGHVRAAQAIERAILETGAAREVRHVDTLEYTNKLFRNLYSKAYIEMVSRMPDVLGWLYDQFDKPWQNERLLAILLSGANEDGAEGLVLALAGARGAQEVVTQRGVGHGGGPEC